MLIDAVFYRSTENLWSEASQASIYYLGNLKRFKSLLCHSIKGTVLDLVLGEAVKIYCLRHFVKRLSCHGLSFDRVIILQVYKKLTRDTTVLYSENFLFPWISYLQRKREVGKICSARAGTVRQVTRMLRLQLQTISRRTSSNLTANFPKGVLTMMEVIWFSYI